MTRLSDLKVKLFTDGADKAQMLDMAKQPWIAGFTTNPSLLKKAGVSDYAAYGRDLVAAIPDRHISFEVFSDDMPEMVAQARVISAWGRNVYAKLPVTNSNILLSNIYENPGIPPTPCFKYQTSTITITVNGTPTPFTFVLDVAITLTVETEQIDPVTKRKQKETKALLNVSPRNVFNSWALAGMSYTDRIQSTPASVTALLAPLP